jgi:hypothetical protein
VRNQELEVGAKKLSPFLGVTETKMAESEKIVFQILGFLLESI